MNINELKGRALADTAKIEYRKPLWKVRSERNVKDYLVHLQNGACSCPQYLTTRRKCKHFYAAKWVSENGRKKPNPPRPSTLANLPKKEYPQQNWRTYNPGQVHEKKVVLELLRGLCNTIVEPPQGMGRKRKPLSEMTFACVMKVYGMMSGRRSSTDMEIYEQMGFLKDAPEYNTIFKYMASGTMTEVLNALLEQSTIPLYDIENDFAIDSSGFANTNYMKWNDEKWGGLGHTMRENLWDKVHLVCGVKTNVIAAVRITHKHVNDRMEFEPLVRETAKRFRMKELSADKGYYGVKSHELANELGATAYIPFKINATGEGTELWRKCYHHFQYHRQDFLDHYHKRSNAETTFWMVKSKFGEQVRSKSDVGRKNEILCKCLCHNLVVLVSAIHERGVEVEFLGNNREAA